MKIFSSISKVSSFKTYIARKFQRTNYFIWRLFTTNICFSAWGSAFKNIAKKVGSAAKKVGSTAQKVAGSGALHEAALKASLATGDSLEDEEDEDEDEHEEFQSPKGNYFKFCY